MKKQDLNDTQKGSILVFQGKKMYFRRSTERRFYFLMTVTIAVLGILEKIGFF